MHGCNNFDGRRAFGLAARAAMAGGWGGHGPFGRHGPFGPEGPFGPAGPFGPGGPFGGGRRGPRGPRGRMFNRDELRLVLLSLIGEQARHGYDLIKALEERSGGHYSPSPGVIYPALSLLADEGLVAEQASDDQRRKFAITEAGRAVLAEEAEAADAALERLKDLGERAERHRAPPVERAAFNLFAAVSQRMGKGGEDELAHQVAEILDEAAQRIERL